MYLFYYFLCFGVLSTTCMSTMLEPVSHGGQMLGFRSQDWS